MTNNFDTTKVKEALVAGFLVISLALGTTACKSSDNDPKGFDPNMDTETLAPSPPTPPQDNLH